MIETTDSSHRAALPDPIAPSSQEAERLVASAYCTLRELARRYLRRERSDHTLQPTALVHEAYLRLSRSVRFEWQDRAHFIGVAARTMRQILVGHAKRRDTLKRGKGCKPQPLDESSAIATDHGAAFLQLDHALDELARFDPRASQVVELRFFGGLNSGEVAEVLGVSEVTVRRDWGAARSWLNRYLKEG